MVVDRPSPPAGDAEGCAARILYGIALAFVLLGFGLQHRWVAREIGRLDPAEALWVWSADLVSLLICLKVVVFGPGLGRREGATVPLRTRITAFVIGVLAVALDAGAVIHHFKVDARRYEAATAGQGQITKVRRRSDLVSLEITYDHPAAGQVRANDEHNIRDLRQALPKDIVARIEAPLVPIAVPVRYDPANAKRYWLGYALLSRSNSVHWWSLGVLFFQFVLWFALFSKLSWFVFENLMLGVLALEGFFLWLMFFIDLFSGMLP